MQRVYSLLVDNNSGVLSRISGLSLPDFRLSLNIRTIHKKRIQHRQYYSRCDGRFKIYENHDCIQWR